MKNENFAKNCQIVEKHLALSVLNQEKKQFMQSYNDKYRAKMAKDGPEQGSPFMKAQEKHMMTLTFAPDLVKLTKKDIDKLLKPEKKED